MTITLPSIAARRGAFVLEMPEIVVTLGQIIGIFGRSGCGKSTYLNKLAAQRPFGTLALLPQDDDVFDYLTVQQNVELGLLPMRCHLRSDAFGLTSAMIDNFDLQPILTREARYLSGGQRRRVALARTMIAEPSLLLLDEPFNGLGRHYEQKAMHALSSRTGSQVTVIVSHDLALLESFCHRILLVDEGHLVADMNCTAAGWQPPSLRAAETIGIHNVVPARLADRTVFGDAQVLAFWRDWATLCDTASTPSGAELLIRADFEALHTFFVEGRSYCRASARIAGITIPVQVRVSEAACSAPIALAVTSYYLVGDITG